MQQWLPWIFVFLAVAIVVGPIMLIKPSNRAQRQAALRTQAGVHGLMVAMVKVGAYDQPLAGYTLPLQRKAGQRIATWQLERKTFKHEGHFLDDWDWFGTGRPLVGASQDFTNLRAILAQVIPEIVAVGENRAGVYLVWTERGIAGESQDAVATVTSILEQLQACSC